MQPYGGIGASAMFGMDIDDMIGKLAGSEAGQDFFDVANEQIRKQRQDRHAELTALAQDIANCFSSPSGQAVLTWMMEKTLLNPALPFDYGKTFEELAPWRAGREGENAFVFQILLAIHQHKQQNGVGV